MEKINKNFNLYDELGYIYVGLFGIMIGYITYVLFFSVISNFFEVFKINNLIFIILGSYLLGHLVQGISNLSFGKKEDKNKEKYLEKELIVIKKAKKFFKLKGNFTNKEIFQYIYMYSLSNDFSGQVVKFNSLYSFYRGISFLSKIFFITFIILIVIGFILSNFFKIDFIRINLLEFIIVVLLFFIYYIFNKRMIRFSKYFKEKVFITFNILKNNLNK